MTTFAICFHHMLVVGQAREGTSEHGAIPALHLVDMMLSLLLVHLHVDADERFHNTLVIDLQETKGFQIDELAVARLEPIAGIPPTFSSVVH